MKNKVKKFAALALALAMIFALAACGEPTEPSEETGQPTGETEPSLKPEDIKLAYACWNLTNEWFISLVEGFEDACEELGCEAVITDSQYILENQINDIENLVNSGVNAIAFSAVDQTATHDIVERAKEQGVIIGSTAQYQENGNYAFAQDEYDYG